jgi:cell division protein FtsB
MDGRPEGVGRGRSPRQQKAFRAALLLVLVLCGLALWASLTGDGGITVMYEQRALIRELEGKIALEEARKHRMLARIDALRSDTFQLERIAREELGLVREREIVYDFRAKGYPSP